VGDGDPGGGAFDRLLPVLCEASAPTEPGEGALDDPAARLNFEAADVVGALDDLHGPIANLVESVTQLRPCISSIGEDVAQPRKRSPDGGEHLRSRVTILNIGSMDDQRDHQSERVGHDVALAALDFLARVIAANSAAFRGLNALAVDHACGWTGIAPLQLPRCHNEMMVDRLQQPAVAPIVEVALDRRRRRKVVREKPPLTACRGHVEDGVQNVPQIGVSRSANPPRRRQERLNETPFSVGQVACIAATSPFIFTTGDFSPRHVIPVLLRNRTESQQTEITQLFLG
jgi:hypothetical protein